MDAEEEKEVASAVATMRARFADGIIQLREGAALTSLRESAVAALTALRGEFLPVSDVHRLLVTSKRKKREGQAGTGSEEDAEDARSRRVLLAKLHEGVRAYEQASMVLMGLSVATAFPIGRQKKRTPPAPLHE